MSCLIVYNLPDTITKMDLMEMFSQKGRVTNIQLVFTYENNNYCFALITYQTEEEAKTALIHFDKTYLDSSSVRIGIERCYERVDENDENGVLDGTIDHSADAQQDNSTLSQQSNNINTKPSIQRGVEVFKKNPNLTYPSQLKEVKLNQLSNDRYSTSVKETTEYDTVKKEESISEIFIQDTKSTLNKLWTKGYITDEQLQQLSSTIDSFVLLEKLVDLFLEMVIYKGCSLNYSISLCLRLQFLRVDFRTNQEIGMTFMQLMRRKLNSVFYENLHKVQKINSEVQKLAEITSRKDQEQINRLLKNVEIKKRQLEILTNICGFIGELYSKGKISPDFMSDIMEKLVAIHEVKIIKCLGDLLVIELTKSRHEKQGKRLVGIIRKLKIMLDMEMENDKIYGTCIIRYVYVFIENKSRQISLRLLVEEFKSNHIAFKN